jgi:hypothetical protein
MRRLTARLQRNAQCRRRFYRLMEKSFVPVFILLAAAAVVLIYAARPSETPEQYAQRSCRESPATGISFERCVEGRRLERLSGRPEMEP